VRRVAGWVAERELWWVILVAPPLVFPEVIDREVVWAALGVLPLFWLCRWLSYRQLTLHSPLNLAVGFIVLMLPSALYASFDLQLSLPKLTGILLGTSVFFSVLNSVKGQRRMWLLVELLLLAGLVMCAVSLVGTDWSQKFPGLGPVLARLPRLISSIPHVFAKGGIHPNEVGGSLALFVPLAWSLLWTKGYNQKADGASMLNGWIEPRGVLFRLLALFSFVVFALVLLLSQSRSAIFGVAVALLVWGAIRYWWVRWLAVFLAVGTVIVVWQVGVEHIGDLVFAVGDATVAPGTLDFAGRREVWSRALYMLQDFPFTGIGLNTFPFVANTLYPFFLIGPDAKVPHAHNILLQTGVDLGLPSLVAFISVLAGFWLMGWQVYRHSRDGATQALALGLGCGMLAHQVYGLTDAVTLGAKPGVFLWIMLGTMAVLCRQTLYNL